MSNVFGALPWPMLVMIGAGSLSDRPLQYFVSFGAWGLIGVIVLGVLHVGFGDS